MRRIGIDVGGTNTDAVLIDGNRVLAAVKTATTADVLGGVRTALSKLLAETAGEQGRIAAVVIGTTHFTNAVIERRALQQVGALRIGLPASASLRGPTPAVTRAMTFVPTRRSASAAHSGA